MMVGWTDGFSALYSRLPQGVVRLLIKFYMVGNLYKNDGSDDILYFKLYVYSS